MIQIKNLIFYIYNNLKRIYIPSGNLSIYYIRVLLIKLNHASNSNIVIVSLPLIQFSALQNFLNINYDGDDITVHVSQKYKVLYVASQASVQIYICTYHIGTLCILCCRHSCITLLVIILQLFENTANIICATIVIFLYYGSMRSTMFVVY